jgi:hypothetical protein
MPELDLQADPREIITRMWPEHAKHLSPAGNTMGGGKIDPDEGVVCNCGQVLGYPTVQDEADYVMAEPDQPDTSGAQTGEPDDEYDPDGTIAMREAQELISDVADGRRVEREHATDPDGDMPEGWQDAAAAGWTENPVGQAYAMGVAAGQHERCREGQEGIDEDTSGPDGDLWDSEGNAIPARPLTAPGDEAQAGDGSASYYGPSGEPNEIPPDGPPKGIMPWRDQGVVPAEDPIAARVVVIDPTRPYGPQDVEHQLLDIAGRIERGVHFQRYWEERHFAAKSAYVQKSARERLKATGGAKDVRDAAVVVACAEEWQELELCEAMVRAVRETMHNLRSLQSGYQTVARSVNDSTRNPAGSYGRA